MIKCRVCESKKLRLLYPLKGKFILYACEQCEAVSLWPTPSITDVHREHDRNYSKPYEADDTKEIKIIDFENICKKIKSKEIKSVLEIGCANAYVTEYCINKGMFATGIDIDENLIKLANQRIGKENLILGDFEDYKFQRKYDLVVTVDLLEHISNPKKFLNKTNQILTSNGLVIIVTPNIETFKRNIFGKYWTGYYLEHLCCMSRKSIKYLAKETDFDIIHLDSFHKTVSLRYFVSKLSFKFGFLRFMNKLVEILSYNPIFRINDDSMLVVLKKR